MDLKPLCQWIFFRRLNSADTRHFFRMDDSLPDAPTMAERLRLRMEQLNTNPRALSIAATGKPDAVRQILQGRVKSPRSDTITGLAKALGVSEGWLLNGGDDSPSQQPTIRPTPNASEAAIPIPSLQSMPRDVPVFGTASGSVAGAAQGAWQITSDPVDYVRRAPGLATARDAYALYVENSSMEPRFPPGELVFIHPGRPVRSGDIVVLQVQNAEHEPIETYIKVMVRRANGDVICRQYNPEAEIRFVGKTVLRVHRVLTMAEVLGA